MCKDEVCVRVRLFGEAREAMGFSSLVLHLPSSSVLSSTQNSEDFLTSIDTSNNEKEEGRRSQEERSITERKVAISRRDLLHQLGDQYPALEKILPSCRLALDHSLIEDEEKEEKEERSSVAKDKSEKFLILSPDSQLALLPPVSGG